jgi:hypothetical protein
VQPVRYHCDMPAMKRTTVRLSSIQLGQLARLAQKLQIDQANVIRLAITRLAESEGLLKSTR